MPTISEFYGIIIMMFLRGKEHNPPHIHAYYGEQVAIFSIENGELLAGSLKNRAAKMVKEFIALHRDELLDMWNGGPFVRIKGLE